MIDSEELIQTDSYTPETSRIFHLHGIDVDSGQCDDIDFDTPAKEVAEIEDRRILDECLKLLNIR